MWWRPKTELKEREYWSYKINTDSIISVISVLV